MIETEITNRPIKIMSLDNSQSIDAAISGSWSKIAPFWPLKNLVAVNPIAGFEDFEFKEALKQANAYFQQNDMPAGMEHVNRESIKWLQAFFDQGQSTIRMPLRDTGLLKSTLSLMCFDKKLHDNNTQKMQWLKHLPENPKAIIKETLSYLKIKTSEQEQFLTLMLTTLPGWAAHIQYKTNWADAADSKQMYTVSQSEYLAFRLVLTCLLWPQAKELLDWHKNALKKADVTSIYNQVVENETDCREKLLKQLDATKTPKSKERADAQLVFCIDVRSEPFRRALEATGNYETYGFAGFFGIPVSISDTITGESYASCPVLLKPAYNVDEKPDCSHKSHKENHNRITGVNKLYQSLKYTFTSPFSLVETIGMASGIWMGIRSLSPKGADSVKAGLKNLIAPRYSVLPDVNSIPFEQQVAYGASALKMMGFTENFAPLVVFCGHGSKTENNAYATSLDCGACGGRHGAPNARILATILNKERVRDELRTQHINIPNDTTFLAAEHNTTTDEVEIYDIQAKRNFTHKIQALIKDLRNARNQNSLWRCTAMGVSTTLKDAPKTAATRAKDWAQVRPEWGLAKNAAFIVAPRWLTENINLEGRTFLHSYEWEKDNDSSSLTTILTAPMVVAQWINSQYLFSTLDNVAYGGGSKVTKNIVGKIGIMQGNASDLMHGLPLQSVFKTDNEAYHIPVRLTAIVYAPKAKINAIVEQNRILQKLFGNGWVQMVCYDPHDKNKYELQQDLIWKHIK